VLSMCPNDCYPCVQSIQTADSTGLGCLDQKSHFGFSDTTSPSIVVRYSVSLAAAGDWGRIAKKGFRDLQDVDRDPPPRPIDEWLRDTLGAIRRQRCWRHEGETGRIVLRHPICSFMPQAPGVDINGHPSGIVEDTPQSRSIPCH
jgi:hypothetical protein